MEEQHTETNNKEGLTVGGLLFLILGSIFITSKVIETTNNKPKRKFLVKW